MPTKQTIDITPTWAGIMPAMLSVLEQSVEGLDKKEREHILECKMNIREEIMQCARNADILIAQHKFQSKEG